MGSRDAGAACACAGRSQGSRTLHPSFRGLMVCVRASGDPFSCAYAEVYAQRGRTRVDYFVRSFVQDKVEDLRFRTLRLCL